MVDLLIWFDLALVCVVVSGDAYLFAYPYAWTANFEMRLEGIASAGDSACNSELISASTSEPISAGADDSNCMSASNSFNISINCRRSKNVQFSLRKPYQNFNFLAPEHQMPIWVGSTCTRTEPILQIQRILKLESCDTCTRTEPILQT